MFRLRPDFISRNLGTKKLSFIPIESRRSEVSEGSERGLHMEQIFLPGWQARIFDISLTFYLLIYILGVFAYHPAKIGDWRFLDLTDYLLISETNISVSAAQLTVNGSHSC